MNVNFKNTNFTGGVSGQVQLSLNYGFFINLTKIVWEMDTQFYSLNELNESLNFIQVLDNVTDFVYYLGLDHKIIWVNKTVREAIGLELESFIGRSCFEVFHSRNNVCSQCPVGKINETGNQQQGDILFKDNSEHNVKGLPIKNKEDIVIGIVIIAKNITIQRNAETAIEKAEIAIETEQTWMNILMDNIPDRIYFKDLDSRFIRVNKALVTQHFLQDTKMAVGLTDFDLFTNEHALQALNDELAIIQTGNSIVNLEEKETFANGRITWVLTSKMPLFDKEGKIKGTFGISHDITNRKLAEEKINQYVGELKELNATKDKFFSIIAHDLKNPFNNILGFSELLKEEVDDNDIEAIKQYANLIYSSAHQTFRLLENLLDWANTQQGHMLFRPENLPLNEIASEITETLQQFAIKKNIDIKNTINEEIIVFADRNMLKSILRNLVTNAIKFTPKNGKIEISSSIHEQQVEITVYDNGIGMDEKTCEQLFSLDVNHTTKGTENENGTGLGLILIKEFILKHGGKLSVASEIGKGSAFKFILPLGIGD